MFHLFFSNSIGVLALIVLNGASELKNPLYTYWDVDVIDAKTTITQYVRFILSFEISQFTNT